MGDNKEQKTAGENRVERLWQAIWSLKSLLWFCIVLVTLLLTPNLVGVIRHEFPWTIGLLTVQPSLFHDGLTVLLAVNLGIFLWKSDPARIRFRHLVFVSIVMAGYLSYSLTVMGHDLATMELIPCQYGAIILTVPIASLVWRYLHHQWRLSQPIQSLSADRFDDPLNNPEEDLLNYTPVVEHVVDRLFARNLPLHAIGIQGRYGIGKTTFLNFLERRIEARQEKAGTVRLKVIRFTPWRTSEVPFVKQLIELLINECRNSKPQLTDAFRAFLSDLSSTPHGGWARMLLAPKNIKGDRDNPSEIKNRIERLLFEHGVQFIVFVDDLDRLLPEEIAQVLKLIRNTVDFNGITYILTYDRIALEGSLGKAQSVEEGYMEKFVQLQIIPPALDQKTLLQILQSELVKQINGSASVMKDVDINDLGLELFDIKLRTPREAKRLAAIFVASYIRIIEDVDVREALAIAYWLMHHPFIVHNIYYTISREVHSHGWGTRDITRGSSWERFAEEIRSSSTFNGASEHDTNAIINSFLKLFDPSSILPIRSRKSIVVPTNISRYFNFTLPSTELSEKEYRSLISADDRGLILLAEEIVSNHQIISACSRIKSDDSLDFTKAITIQKAIAHSELKNNLGIWGTTSLAYDWVAHRLYKDQYTKGEFQQYHDSLRAILDNPPYLPTYESEIVYRMLCDPNMKRDGLLLSIMECFEYLSKYVRMTLTKERELNSRVAEALRSCIYEVEEDDGSGKSRQVNKVIPQLPQLLVEVYEGYGAKAYFEYWLRTTRDALRREQVSDEAEPNYFVYKWHQLVCGDQAGFRAHIAALSDDEYKHEFLTFYDEFVAGAPLKPIPFNFKWLKPSTA